MTRAAQRAADSLAAEVLNKTVRLGVDRSDVLEAVARTLTKRASEERAQRIDGPEALTRECLACNGTGERMINEDWPSGDAPYSEKCPTCGGTGETDA